MTDINLDELSVTELEALKAGIDGAVERKKSMELLELREQIDELVDNSPFTLDEVLEAKPMRKPVLPKYKNPANESETWTGRGRQPRWVVAYLGQGGMLEDIAI